MRSCHPHDLHDHNYNSFFGMIHFFTIDYLINSRSILLVIFEEFPLEDYHWQCNYNPHLRRDETHISMWNCLRISFPDLDKNVLPQEKTCF